MTHKASADVAARLFEYASFIHNLVSNSLSIKKKVMQHSKEEFKYFLCQKSFLLRLDYSLFFNLQSLALIHEIVHLCEGSVPWTVDEIIQKSKIQAYRKMAKRRGSVSNGKRNKCSRRWHLVLGRLTDINFPIFECQIADTIFNSARASRQKRNSLFAHEELANSKRSIDRLKAFHKGAEKSMRKMNPLGLSPAQLAELQSLDQESPRSFKGSWKKKGLIVGVPTSTRRPRRRTSLFQNSGMQNGVNEDVRKHSFSTRTIHRRSIVHSIESFSLPDDKGGSIEVQDKAEDDNDDGLVECETFEYDKESASFSLGAAKSQRFPRKAADTSMKWRGPGSRINRKSDSRRGEGSANQRRSGYMNDVDAAKLATKIAERTAKRGKRNR